MAQQQPFRVGGHPVGQARRRATVPDRKVELKPVGFRLNGLRIAGRGPVQRCVGADAGHQPPEAGQFGVEPGSLGGLRPGNQVDGEPLRAGEDINAPAGEEGDQSGVRQQAGIQDAFPFHGDGFRNRTGIQQLQGLFRGGFGLEAGHAVGIGKLIREFLKRGQGLVNRWPVPIEGCLSHLVGQPLLNPADQFLSFHGPRSGQECHGGAGMVQGQVEVMAVRLSTAARDSGTV